MVKQFKSYRPTRQARPDGVASKILWFTVEHAVGILAVIIVLIIWRLISL
jgi:hypothetical protein